MSSRPARATLRRARYFGSAVFFALMVFGCEGSTVVEGEVAELRQAVLEGYVDDATSGVVGLGVSARGGFVVGHCSGALIAPNLVLTARHCVMRIARATDDVIVCGDTPFGETYAAGRLIVSPSTEFSDGVNDVDYLRGRSVHVAPGGEDFCGYDLALIVLEDSFDETRATPLVPRVDERARVRETFSAAGYGLTGVSSSSPSGTRMRTDERSVSCSGDSCLGAGMPLSTDLEWLSRDANICRGDSGGPALDQFDRVIGVASRGPASCDAAVYVDVAAWGSFIIETVLHAAEMGGYPAPSWALGQSTDPTIEAHPTGRDGKLPAEPSLDESGEPVLDEGVGELDGEVACPDDDCTATRRRELPTESCAVGGAGAASSPSGWSLTLLLGLLWARARGRVAVSCAWRRIHSRAARGAARASAPESTGTVCDAPLDATSGRVSG